MKRLSFIVALLVIATGAFAQSGAMQTNTSESRYYGNIFGKMTNDNYGRLYIGYNPINADWEEEGESDWEDMYPMNHGLTLGYMHASNIVKSLPLYVEYGANFAWAFGKYDDKETYNELSWKMENKLNMFSINVPVNLAFRFSFADNSFSVTPYLGLNFRVNVAGTTKQSLISKYKDGDATYTSTQIVKYKLFSSDETDLEDEDAWDIDKSGNETTREATTGMGDYAFKRFQVGFNVGVAASYKRLHFGIGYVADFNNLVNYDDDLECKLGVPTISLGITF
jgi:hypothetical protein